MATEEAVMAVIRASRPTFKSQHDKIAFAFHSTFLTSGYTLIATGSSAFSETVYSSPPSDEVGIDGWNQTDESYGFVYTQRDDEGLKKTVLIKCLVMGDYLVIDVLCSKYEDKEISVQVNVNEYCEENSGSTNYADKYKNFGKLVKLFNSDILSKIEEPPKKATPAPAPLASRSEQNQREPLSSEPYHPGFVVPPIPSGHHDDARPGPGAGIYPRINPEIGGPMLVGPNDPRWFHPQPGFPSGSPGVPPGARFDPIGPSGVPGFEPNRFIRDPRRPPGGHPDLEHFGGSDFI